MMDPFNCDGCHSGDFPGFDHFCDALNVADDDLPHAFAAYLAHETTWDGEYEKVCQCGCHRTDTRHYDGKVCCAELREG